MKKLACLILSCVLLCGCTPGVTETDAVTTEKEAPKTDPAVQTEPVPTPEASIEVTAFSVKDGKLELTLSVTGAFDGKLRFDAESDSDSTSAFLSGNFIPGNEYTLISANAANLGNNFSVTAYAVYNDEVLDSASFTYKDGLPQLTADSINLIIPLMTIQEKASMLIGWGNTAVSGASAETYAVERFGITPMTYADGPSGVRIGTTSIGYPTGTVLASSWDNDLMRKVTASMGEDCKFLGVDILLAPGMNLQKNILNGRNFEYFSEDPFLTGMMAANYTLGIQSTGTGVALKHYAANNQETARGNTSSTATERAFREMYLRGFAYAVKAADPYSVMTSYNRIHKVYSQSNKELVSDILYDEFGFGGLVMSDWGASCESRAKMITARNSMFCGGADNAGDAKQIASLVKSGEVSEADLNRCVIDILGVVVRSNTYNGNTPSKSYPKSERTEKLALVRAAGAEGMVLLKNDNSTLPIKNINVALFGNAAVYTETGGYGSGNVNVVKKVSITDALRKNDAGIVLNSTVLNLYKNCKSHGFTASMADNPENDTLEIVITDAQAKKAASESEAAIMVISRITTEGLDHTAKKGDYQLNDSEAATLAAVSKAFHAAGKKVIMILNTGFTMEMASWRDSVDAILYCGLPGEQAGYSVCDVLTGAVNPSGKLVATVPMCYADTPASDYFPGSVDESFFYEDIYVGYRYYSTFNIDVAYEFGYGLSYTSFEYSDFKTSGYIWDGSLTASVKVTNTGSVAGKEIAQFYVSKPDVKNEQPVLELCGYGKTKLLQPGESEIISITVTPAELQTYITAESNWVIEPGTYKVSVGASVKNIKYSENFSVSSEILVLDVENKLAPEGELRVITKETGKQGSIYGTNIALNKPTKAECHEGAYVSSNGNDGDLISRWSGIGSNAQYRWWYVDLEKQSTLNTLRILWESNGAGKFCIYLSDDGKSWELFSEEIYTGTNIVDMKGVKSRFVKIQSDNVGWYSFYECEVYGE